MKHFTVSFLIATLVVFASGCGDKIIKNYYEVPDTGRAVEETGRDFRDADANVGQDSTWGDTDIMDGGDTSQEDIDAATADTIEDGDVPGEVFADTDATSDVSEEVDSTVEDVAEDTSDASDTDTTSDVTEEDVDEEVTTSVLLVQRHSEEDFVLVSDLETERDERVVSYSYCATGTVPSIESLAYSFRGSTYDIRYLIDIYDDVSEREIRGLRVAEPTYDTTISLTSGDSEPWMLPDGGCLYVDISIRYPIADEWTRYTEIGYQRVGLGDSDTPYRVDTGSRTYEAVTVVFRPEDLLRIQIEDRPTSAVEYEVPRNRRDQLIGAYEICSENWSRGMLNSVAFVATATDAMGDAVTDIDLPIEFSINLQGGRWVDLGSRAVIVRPGEFINWNADRPDGLHETIAWGDCIRFRMNLWAVPAGIETLTISLAAVEASPMPLVEHPTLEAYLPFDGTPVPWTRVRFVDPPDPMPRIELEWEGDSSLFNGTDRYLYEEGLAACESFYGEFRWEQWRCDLLNLRAYPRDTDARFPVTFDSFELAFEMDGFTELTLDVTIVLQSDYSEGIVMERAVTIDPGETVHEFLLGYEFVGSDYDQPVQITIRMAEQEFDRSVAEDEAASLQVEVRSFDASYVGVPLPVTLGVPEEVEDRPFERVTVEHPLPVAGPLVHLQRPEFNFGYTRTGLGTEIELSLSEDSEASTNLFDSAGSQVAHSALAIRELTFRHNTGKDDSVFETVQVRVRGRYTYVLTEWDRNFAVFTAESDRPLEIEPLDWLEIVMIATGPEDTTLEGEPVRMELIDIVATPMWLDEPFIPLRVGLDEEDGYTPIYLDREDPETWIRGATVRVVE